jgi:hypothetical protein
LHRPKFRFFSRHHEHGQNAAISKSSQNCAHADRELLSQKESCLPTKAMTVVCLPVFKGSI